MGDKPILVLGATGGQGGAVVTGLLERGVRVRALARDPLGSAARRLARRGVQVMRGALDDASSLVVAMTGTAGVFALTTPFGNGVDAEIHQGRAILTAAGKALVPHLVFSSVACSGQRTGVPHFESKAWVEFELPACGVPYTVLGPTSFFENLLAGRDRIRGGILDLPLPADRPLQQLARSDLGAFAAEVLLRPDAYAGQRIELAGDVVTPAKMAATLTRILGRPVRHERTPLEAIADPDMRAMWRFLDDPGYQVDALALHLAHPEIPWTSFTGWALKAF
ncbi:NmrA/HSCARG family protein [Actinomadura verrucosospora]|uniref:NmrA family transcriptional regulator n=1 Tax=Actinomadura verrucosospora TaxID=46165 RepID=A0A7D4A3X3_ACTVE|nr:NmrA/HSCARG family protein [Actinomadura verrucosospora]QKG24564.1 NmrA family transcriptional regulator [Actinomadura verrucosospora]